MPSLLQIAQSDMSDIDMQNAIKQNFDNAILYVSFGLICRQNNIDPHRMFDGIADDVLETSGINKAMNSSEITNEKVDQFNINFDKALNFVKKTLGEELTPLTQKDSLDNYDYEK